MAAPSGIQVKVERAKKHIDDLHAITKDFYDSTPYEVVRDIESKTGDHIWKLKVLREVPPDTSAIIGDAIHNLRGALDHLMATLVKANGGNVTNATEFPIFASVDSYNAKAGGKVAGAHPDAIKVVDALKPYKGGNDGFWRIHKLDLIDKHRDLVPVVSSNEAVGIDVVASLRKSFPEQMVGFEPMLIDLRPAHRGPLNDGDHLYRVAADQIDNVDDNPTFRFEMALREPGVVECEPLFPGMPQLFDLVNGTFAPFERYL